MGTTASSVCFLAGWFPERVQVGFIQNPAFQLIPRNILDALVVAGGRGVGGPVVVGDRLGGVTVDGAGGDWGPGPPGGVGGGGGPGGSGVGGPAGMFGGWR